MEIQGENQAPRASIPNGNGSSADRDGLLLWPHRSLSQKGFRILMAVLGSLMVAIGLIFFLMGAWPVVGFLGLEILVVWAFFRMNYKSARQREKITANPATFRIERTSPDGETAIEELPSPWLKAELEPSAPPKSGQPQRLVVKSHGRKAEIGPFLHAVEKQELLPEINALLSKVQR
ncbi:DUF2244 domain-containing protein [Alphaproteobacteria bacterium LSUCC0684]